jgi:ribose transport system substrate-binding protein
MLLNRKFIFIVEANPQNRLVFRVALSRQAGWVEFEPLGDNALEHLKRLARVDLIILNLTLPGHLSGYDLFDQIRRHDMYAGVPILGMTTFDFEGALARTQNRGFDGLILKPIDINHFPRQVARAIEGEQIWPTLSQSTANK